ncbi:Ff.00g001340.m01.CDS01 [Fusarium sp. VM40]|nr:Ff.00g001340.m01.CDS01 [Fusarium sp. VM40]
MTSFPSYRARSHTMRQQFPAYTISTNTSSKMADKNSKTDFATPAQGAPSSEVKERTASSMSTKSAGPALEAQNDTPRARSRARSPGPSKPKKPKRKDMSELEFARAMHAFYRDRATWNFHEVKKNEEMAKLYREWMERDADSTVENALAKLDEEEAAGASSESVIGEAHQG